MRAEFSPLAPEGSQLEPEGLWWFQRTLEEALLLFILLRRLFLDGLVTGPGELC